MTYNETMTIMTKLAVIYPEKFDKQTDADAAALARLWCELLEDYDFRMVNEAIKYYIKSDRSGYMPKPGQILGIIGDIFGKRRPTAAELWQQMLKKLNDASQNAYEAFISLPKPLQDFIGDPMKMYQYSGFTNRDVEIVLYGRFEGFYDNYCKEHDTEKLLPASAKALRRELLPETAGSAEHA